MKRRLWLAAVVIVASLLSACVSTLPPDVYINHKYNGQHLTLHQGQNLIIEFNQEYSDQQLTWKVVSEDNLILSKPTKQVLQLEDRAQTIERFIFKVVAAGHGELVLEQVKKNEWPLVVEQTFNLNIAVYSN